MIIENYKMYTLEEKKTIYLSISSFSHNSMSSQNNKQMANDMYNMPSTSFSL